MKLYIFRLLRFMFMVGVVFFSLSCVNESTQIRVIEDFNEEWKFELSEEDLSSNEVNDSDWRTLSLPHDWSIEGSFDPENPATVGGGALPGGIGWYRKHFDLADSDSSKLIFIHFDGIYWNSEVYLNGHLVGARPNGYVSFRYELTTFLNFGDEKNILTVKVDNSNQPNSRWYSGSGIYRNVRLIKSDPVYIENWSTFITTAEITPETATIAVSTKMVNSTSVEQNISLNLKIMSADDVEVGTIEKKVSLAGNSEEDIEFEMNISDPELWSVDDPTLYNLEISVFRDGKAIDDKSFAFGIRSFRFDSMDGFFLNEQPLKILGVCNHHDLGCLGSAVNARAIKRQLEILKGMGCNAIRTSHNPPAPELLDLCDQMGFLVMDETFDMWKLKKSKYDYSQYWDEWHERDLSDHILRDRNHPSVIMWSLGNEILEQWDSTGTAITQELAEIVLSLDDTRTIVTGNNYPEPSNAMLKADVMDLIAYNYHHEEYLDFHKKFPGKSFIAAETTSGLMTRGQYDMPSDSIRRWPIRWDIPFEDGNPDQSVSSYDNVSAPWGSTHEETWGMMKKHDYMSGMFIWTGFDYLGEPTPYGWPSRSSYFGVVDLAGFPKDIYYMYRSEWTDEPVLHVFPHWNWEDGQNIDVLAYTNCESVELFLNGESLGIRENSDSIFHLTWNIDFKSGELKAVGILPGGDRLESTSKTAGSPAKLELSPDRSEIMADGRDLSFITISVLDEDGIMVPRADNLVSFTIEGPAEIVGVDNGNQVSHESFKADHREAFNGKCLLVIKSKQENGTVKITARAEGLKEETVEIRVGD